MVTLWAQVSFRPALKFRKIKVRRFSLLSVLSVLLPVVERSSSTVDPINRLGKKLLPALISASCPGLAESRRSCHLLLPLEISAVCAEVLHGHFPCTLC